jgi:hypothetical protein
MPAIRATVSQPRLPGLFPQTCWGLSGGRGGYARRMWRERLRDLAFIAVVVIVLTWVGLALWTKADACSDRGGRFEIFVRSVYCVMPDGERVPW